MAHKSEALTPIIIISILPSRWRTGLSRVQALTIERADEEAGDCFRNYSSGPQILPYRTVHQRKCTSVAWMQFASCVLRMFPNGGTLLFCSTLTRSGSLNVLNPHYCRSGKRDTIQCKLICYLIALSLFHYRIRTSCLPPSSRTIHFSHGLRTQASRPPRSTPPLMCMDITMNGCPRTVFCIILIAKWNNNRKTMPHWPVCTSSHIPSPETLYSYCSSLCARQ